MVELMSETYAIGFAAAVTSLLGASWVWFPSLLHPMYLVPLVSLWGYLQRRIAAGPSFIDTARQQGLLLQSRVAIVTGANSGIGFYTALRLAELGCKVVISCRTQALLTDTIRRMNAEFEQRKVAIYAAQRIPVAAALDIVDGYTLELDNKASIAAFAQKFVASGLPCHILVNNAGMMVKPLQFSKQNPNLELHTAVNFMGPVMLTELLMPTIKQSGGRVVNVASAAHRMPDMLANGGRPVDSAFVLAALKSLNRGAAGASGPLACSSMANAFGRYGVSKLCNIYHSHYIATVHGVPVCALHPGCVATGFTRNLLFPWVKKVFDVASLLFIKTEEEGAETTILSCIADASKLQSLPDPRNGASARIAPYFVDGANATRRLLRPLGWDGHAGVEATKWAIETMNFEHK